MTVHTTRQVLTGVALASVLALVAACSGASPSMSPTAPTASAASASANFSPNPDCDAFPESPECQPPPTCETDPTLCEPPDLASGRFTGGGFQINDLGIKITRGFTIHCDNRLTNNLEINWDGANNFHIDKESLIDVVCTKPHLPNPPDADVSRIVATSPGTCNKLPAMITFILEDRGEPGTSDRAGFVITGGCSLNLSERFIDGGNIQAHFDQPHKNK